MKETKNNKNNLIVPRLFEFIGSDFGLNLLSLSIIPILDASPVFIFAVLLTHDLRNNYSNPLNA